MEDTIEVCSGCGKMPRPIDHTNGYFSCSRCGTRTTIYVTVNDYERTVSDLDQKFHSKLQQNRISSAINSPVESRSIRTWSKKVSKVQVKPKSSKSKPLKKPVSAKSKSRLKKPAKKKLKKARK